MSSSAAKGNMGSLSAYFEAMTTSQEIRGLDAQTGSESHNRPEPPAIPGWFSL